MLVIEYENTRDVTWYVGHPQPSFFNAVVCVQADGHELDHITKMFEPSIPIPKGPVVKFCGDTAKMIVANLTNIPYEY